MSIFIGILIFVYGLIFGSFFNVVGYRIPKKLSLLHPGSYCPNCRHKLRWYELIPIFSYAIQGGRCTNCKRRISLYYPFIEFLTGVLFLTSYLIFGITPKFYISILISSYLVIVIVSDGRYMIIPDEVTLVFSILIVILNFIFSPFENALTSFASGFVLIVILLLFMLICNKIFGKETLGGGDIKLMFFIANVLGIPNALFAIFVASVIALPFSLYFILRKKSKIFPFGPFLLGGTLLVYLLQINIIELLS